MKYAYDDYEDEGARGGDIETIVAVPDDEYLSAEDDDNPIPQPDQQQPGRSRENGVYVTRSNRVVRIPDRY